MGCTSEISFKLPQLMKNLMVLVTLALIGLLAHYPSLSMAVYGDDWFGIFYYLSKNSNGVHYGFFPEPFAILVPYGFSVFVMGILYKLFGLNSTLYYLVSLILRVFASYAMFVTCKTSISKTNKLLSLRSFIICFLVSLLFLVGLSGIEVTDWLFNMNVYLATGFYLLGIRSQIKFLCSGSRIDAIISVTLSILAAIVAPIRFQAMIILVPMIDVVFLIKKEARPTLKQILIKDFVFIFAMVLLIIVGLFGRSHDIYESLAGGKFLNAVFSNSGSVLSALLQLNGAVILPDSIFRGMHIQIAGFLFVLLLVMFNKLKLKESRVMIHVTSVIYLSFVIVLWFFFPVQQMGTNHRYMLVIFSAWCLLVGIIMAIGLKTFRFFQNLAVILLFVLILLHYNSLQSTYGHWLINGRDQKYTNAIHHQIISSVTLPLTKHDIIYLDFDDLAKNQSIVFGLGYKILVLSNTLDEGYFPSIYDNNIKDSRSLIIKSLEHKISQGSNKEDLMARIFSFQFRDGFFKNTTADLRKELSTLMQ